MNQQLIRWAALLGALLTGGSMIAAGQLVEGAGIVAAALSSTSTFNGLGTK